MKQIQEVKLSETVLLLVSFLASGALFGAFLWEMDSERQMAMNDAPVEAAEAQELIVEPAAHGLGSRKPAQENSRKFEPSRETGDAYPGSTNGKSPVISVDGAGAPTKGLHH